MLIYIPNPEIGGGFMEETFIPEDPEQAEEFLRKDMTHRHYLFGVFLREKGLITGEDVFRARMLQKKHNRRMGELAKKKGWLTDEGIERIHVLQEETLRRFDDIAVQHDYMTQPQVNELLEEMDEDFMFFGEALVNLGFIAEDVMLENLKEFNRIKFVQNLKET
jgi:hypothetical protein